jgi:hypothetical protein
MVVTALPMVTDDRLRKALKALADMVVTQSPITAVVIAVYDVLWPFVSPVVNALELLQSTSYVVESLYVAVSL